MIEILDDGGIYLLNKYHEVKLYMQLKMTTGQILISKMKNFQLEYINHLNINLNFNIFAYFIPFILLFSLANQIFIINLRVKQVPSIF